MIKKLFCHFSKELLDSLEKFYLRDEQNTIKKRRKNFDLEIQGESIEFIYDSHGQTFLFTLYKKVVAQEAKRLGLRFHKGFELSMFAGDSTISFNSLRSTWNGIHATPVKSRAAGNPSVSSRIEHDSPARSRRGAISRSCHRFIVSFCSFHSLREAQSRET